MPALVPCYSPADEAVVRRLGAFLTANLAIEVSYGEARIGDGMDLIDAADRALSADFGLVFLSPDSVPAQRQRDWWAPMLPEENERSETALGFVLLRECSFPKLLQRGRFFDLSADFLNGARAIKRWLLRPETPGVQTHSADHPLSAQLADVPGAVCGVALSEAAAFADSCGRDFEAVYKLDLHGRSRAGMLGDIAHVLGFTLAGTLEQNRADACRHARDHRYLMICANVPEEDREFVTLGGLVSTVFTSPCAQPVPASEKIGSAYFTLPRNDALCFELLGQANSAMRSLFQTDPAAGQRLGWAIVSLLKLEQRNAEIRETLAAMRAAALDCSELDAVRNIEWEQSWFDEDPSLFGTPAPEGSQLSFAFA